MNRITFTFLGFLVVATLSAGTAYQNGVNLLRGQVGGVTALLFLGGALMFGFTLLVLGRIVYLSQVGTLNVRRAERVTPCNTPRSQTK